MLDGEDLSDQIKLWIEEVVEDTVNLFTQDEYAEEWDLEALTQAMAQLYQTEITAKELREDLGEISREALIEEFQTDASDEYEAKEEEFGAELMRDLERFIVLQVVDVRWREHLENMEVLREGVHLRQMAQKDPLVEYTGEGERMFTELGRIIRSEVVLHLFHAELAPEQAQQQLAAADADREREHPLRARDRAGADVIDAALGGRREHRGGRRPVAAPQPVHASEHEKLGRNDPCWCGAARSSRSATARSAMSRRDTDPARRAARGDRDPARLGPWLPLTPPR